MGLRVCPWMVARCPHFTADCKAPESRDCLYVKNTTQSALVTLTQLRRLNIRSINADPMTNTRIKELEIFIKESEKKLRNAGA